MAAVTVCACTVLPLARAGADQLSSEQAKAAQLEQEIQSTGQQIDALDQQYQAAEARKSAIDQRISATQRKIDETRQRVSDDQRVLQKAAIDVYVTDGGSTAQNSLFSGNQTAASAQQEYSSVAEGDVGAAVANLQTAQNVLSAEQSQLRSQDAQAAQAVSAANQAYTQAQAEQSQQQQALSQVKGQIQTLIAQQQQQQAQAAQAAAQAKLAAAQQAAQAALTSQTSGGGGAGATVFAAPPPAPGGGGAAAVAAAMSQIGVPYVWGGESPRGSAGDPSGGFDCSGLVAWAWGQAGVSLPHYSGAQMADSTPVPLSDLQPGDLLFYGPGGSDHVAMYIGGGEMIEAPYTGASVWVTAARFGSGFAGAGRP
ncbi:MAG: C40 family peptidase [Acidimicrobiales bacterium]